jgi:uncharacterized phage protein gp47/JayE
MSGDDFITLNDCGCCEVATPPTPVEIFNRPSLSAIEYRVGTYASFRQSMIDAMASTELTIDGNVFRPLASLTARSDDDYAIALLDMWSYVADILTFYQERIANEAFLRTALQRESILRLAALLGYKPAPGSAASTLLVFTLEKNKQASIPIGLRVQSVPGQNEKPQKFETIGSIVAAARLSRVRAFALPSPVNPFALHCGHATLDPTNADEIATALAPGDNIVVFNTTTTSFEEKRVAAIETKDHQTILSWTPQCQQDFPGGTRAFKFRRKFRIFGYNAPSVFLRPTGTSATGDVIFELVNPRPTAEFNFDPSFGRIQLDSRYDDLRPGSRLLLQVSGSAPSILTISGVGQRQALLYPLDDTVTEVNVGGLPSAAFDRRFAIIYELLDPEITFWSHDYPASISDSTLVVRARDLAATDLEIGRTLLLQDDSSEPTIVTVRSTNTVNFNGAIHTTVLFAPPLSNPLNTATTELFANVVRATHGETVSNEVLGNGDAAASFQSFKVKKSPVTFVPQAGAPNGVANTLRVRVDGASWEEVQSLFGHAANEQVYTTSINDKNEMFVRFGDGATGARATTGVANITAAYRQGLGKGGNVKANSLTTLLDRPLGVKSATNLAAAQGGSEPESLSEARVNAPNTVRTFARVVSLRDFEDAAREFPAIAKAKAIVHWDGLEQVVVLTVAGDDGAAVIGETKDNLTKDLNSRRDFNQKLVMQTYQEVFVQVETVILVDPRFVAEDVRTAAQEALLNYFAFDNLNLGQPIHLSNIYKALQDVRGVKSADINLLQFKDSLVRVSHFADSQPVQAHLRIFANELAVIEQPATDIAVTIGTLVV